MATTPEGKLKKQVKKYLDEENVYYYMAVSNGMGRVGIPDFVCSVGGLYLGIETKAPGKINNATANQLREQAAIIRSGGMSIITDNMADIVNTICILKAKARLTGWCPENT